MFNILPKDKSVIAMKNMVLPSLIFFSSSFLILAATFVNKRKVLPFALTGILLLTMSDSLRFAKKWMPFDPPELAFPEVPVIKVLQKEAGPGATNRVYGSYGAYLDTYYRIPSVEGYDALYNRRYGELLQSAKDGKFNNAIRSLAILEKNPVYADRILDLLGVGLVLHQRSFTFTPWVYPVWGDPGKYIKIYEDDKFQLFRNRDAMPRAKIFYAYEVVNGREKEIKRFFSKDFDFRSSLLLEERPGSLSSGKGEGKAEIVQYLPDIVVINVTSSKSGLLFLSDNYFPRWKAKINGKDAKIYIADYAFRAVIIPQGKSRVEFYYQGLF